MLAKVALVTLLADDGRALARWYRDVLGFQPKGEIDHYTEFEHDGVRFSVCSRFIMKEATGSLAYDMPASGQAVELAFPVERPDDVQAVYEELVRKGATPVRGATDMAWGMRTAFFADPAGNIHEIFALLPGTTL